MIQVMKVLERSSPLPKPPTLIMCVDRQHTMIRCERMHSSRVLCWCNATADVHCTLWNKTTPVGFEPTRGDPIGLAGRRLSRSAKVSLPMDVPH